jgi:hypothetical protein
MSDLRIRQILETRLLAWSAARAEPLEIAVENVGFAPTPGEIYLEATLLPAITRTEFVDGTHEAHIGVFQIDVKAPRGTGAGPAGLIAAELRPIFQTYAVLAGDDGFRVTVMSPLAVGPGIEDVDRYIVPISFNYRADTTT